MGAHTNVTAVSTSIDDVVAFIGDCQIDGVVYDASQSQYTITLLCRDRHPIAVPLAVLRQLYERDRLPEELSLHLRKLGLL